MARPSTITEEEVFTAVRGLLVAGEYPNPANVRLKLNGRGSPPLVARLIRLWYAEHGPELARSADEKPHKAPTESLQAELKRLTTQAMEEISAAEKTRQETLNAQEEKLEQREKRLEAGEKALHEATLRHDERVLAQQKLVNTIVADAAAAMSAKDDALAAKVASDTENEVLQRSIVGLKRAVADVQAIRTQLAVSEAESARAHNRVTELDAAVATQQQRASAYLAQVNEASATNAKLVTDLQAARESQIDLTERAVRAEAACARCEENLRRLNLAVQASEADRETAQRRLDALQASHDVLLAQHQDARQQLDTLNNRLVQQQAEDAQRDTLAEHLDARLASHSSVLLQHIDALLHDRSQAK